MKGYRVIATTPMFPNGVQYPGSDRGHPKPLYSREGAIEMLERLVWAGHKSDYSTEYQCWAEGEGERFMLSDVQKSDRPRHGEEGRTNGNVHRARPCGADQPGRPAVVR